MTFTARERFIYHAATLMTLEIMHRKESKSVTTMSQKKTFDLISLFLKNRCRKLTRVDVDKIYDDIEEEVLLSGPVFDMLRNQRKQRRIGDDRQKRNQKSGNR